MTSSPLAIGIDFGTTKTIAALCQDGQPQPLLSREGKVAMPSRVMQTGQKQILAGWETEARAGQLDNQTYTINAVKRTLGKQGETGWSDWRTRPHEIAAFLLGRVKIEVEAIQRVPVEQAVIAIPAHFDIHQRWAIQQSAEIVGFKVLRLLNEATAAALTYSVSSEPYGQIMVFDFGGGTLDVSLVEVTKGEVHVLGTAGDGKLGGEDLDHRLLQWVEETLKKTLPDFTIQALPHAKQMYLREQVRKAKEILSLQPETHLIIPGFLETRLGSFMNLDLALTRSTFDALCAPFYERAEQVVQDALTTTKINPTTLTRVLAIGGSSRIPAIEARLQRITGQKLSHRGLDPQTCVAYGAALQAGILQGSLKNMLLLDTLAADYSVGAGEKRTKLFSRGQVYPARAKHTFTTAQDLVHTVMISVYEQHPGTAVGGNALGKLELSGLPPAPKGMPKIEVTFDMDADGLLTVAAEDTSVGRKATAVLTSPYRLNESQMRAIRAEVIRNLTPLVATSFAPFPAPDAPFPTPHPRTPAPSPPARKAPSSPPPRAPRSPSPEPAPTPSVPAPSPQASSPPLSVQKPPVSSPPRVVQPPPAPPVPPPPQPSPHPLTQTGPSPSDLPPQLVRAQADAHQLNLRLQQLTKSQAAPQLQQKIPLAIWQHTLSKENYGLASLQADMREVQAGLTLALPALFIQHTQALTHHSDFHAWLATFEERWLGGAEPLGLLNTSLADFPDWKNGFEALVALSETVQFSLNGLETHFALCEERLTFLLVAQRLAPRRLNPFPRLPPQNKPLCRSLLLACTLQAIHATEWGTSQREALRTLGAILPSEHMAGLLVQLDRTQPAFSVAENLPLALETCPPRVVAEAYTRLTSRRQKYWQSQKPVRHLVRHALIQHLRQTAGENQAVTRAALKNLL